MINHIVTRFLKPKYTPDQFNEINKILDLPITALKDVDAIEAAQVNDIFGVQNIRELSGLDPVNPLESLLPKKSEKLTPEKYDAKAKLLIERVLDAIPDFDAFRNHVAVAHMIKRSWSKRAVYLKKKETKMICVGLDNAGKTAILSGLGGKLGINDLAKLKPTKKVDRRKIATETMDLFVWDMGGQQDYRRDYLKKPETYFVRTDMIIYVIDMQDPERYDDSFEYLQNILEIMKLMGETPYILAFMHKSDPDILEDPDFQLNTEFVADKLNYLLGSYEFEFDIYTTSIYNFFTSEPKFSKFIKDTLSDKESLNNPVIRKMEGLGDILDSTMNAIVTLANSLGEQIADLSARISVIEQKLERSVIPLPQTSAEKRQNSQSVQSSQEYVKKPVVSSSPKQQVIYTKKNLGLNPPPGLVGTSSNQPVDSRLEILNDLKGLFQAKRNLDATTPLNKLGSLGKKFDKMKKTTDKKTTK